MHEGGIQINWNMKNSALYTSITLAGFGIVIGWFQLTVFLMNIAR